jgi:two-component system phosphate regulon sensor histidine kinase PhoR
MVDRLLDWAKTERARRMYAPQRAPVAGIVDAALAACEPLRVQGDVTLACELPADVPDVEVDPDAIVDALVNVIQNAYHYTPERGKVIGVGVALEGERVEISVRDNGPGVPANERRKIFERFYRGAAARARRVQGTGLGLAMVRAVVKAHRGDVRVENNVPTGSVFTISLPIADRPR